MPLSVAKLPIGSLLSLGPRGNIVDIEGQLWIPALGELIVPYNAALHAAAPEAWKLSAKILPGPEDGSFGFLSGDQQAGIAYNPTLSMWLRGCRALFNGNSKGDNTVGWSYWTSTNDGVTWSEQVFPNNLAYQVCFVDDKFIGIAAGQTTNALIISTDGVNWTSYNLPAAVSGNAPDVTAGAAGNYVISTTGSGWAYSTDAGLTWAASSGHINTGSSINNNIGDATYNAAAGLFLATTNTVGVYQTSPTGQTWTTRNTQATLRPYANRFGSASASRMASSPTRTVFMGQGGFCATSDDGLTWNDIGYIGAGGNPLRAADVGGNASVRMACYDGTYFKFVIGDFVFYSTDGITWNRGGRVIGKNSQHTFCQTSGRLLRFLTAFMPMTYTDDPTDTAIHTLHPDSAQGSVNGGNYYRMK